MIKRKLYLFFVNKIFAGTNPKFYEIKRKMLNAIGYNIGVGTRVVAPIECYGKLIVGKNTFIGKNFKINGNGTVILGNNCDIAPEVTFQTGGHQIGTANRRAGKGKNYTQTVGDGVWIGGRSTIINNISIGKGSVIAGCACVTKNVPENVIAGGVPAKIIKEL